VDASDVSWRWSTFDELNLHQLYRVLELRQQVFVIEQQSLYLDVDGHDPVCIHGLGYVGSELVAYARIVPAGLTYDAPAIGRVLIAPNARGTGLGHVLVDEAIAEAERRFPGIATMLGAQLHLQAFYESFGYVACGEPYDDGGIMHIDMIRSTV
jgi:ElaA protein